MADKFSFDIVSEVNMQEVDNAVNQALKEVSQRYDFKNSKSSIAFNRTEKKINLVSDDEGQLKVLRELLIARFRARGVSEKSLDIKPFAEAGGMTVSQTIEIVLGIPKEKARELVKIIKDFNIRGIQAQIEDTKVRVSSAKKDELQTVIGNLRSINFPCSLQFTNYR